MLVLKYFVGSSSAKNVATSLFAFASSVLGSLMSIPVAVAYLGMQQIGLWSLVTVVVSYLVCLDLGIGNATGRKIAPAVANGDYHEINRWWTLSITALFILGLSMLTFSVGLSFCLPTLLAIPVAYSKDTISLFLGVAGVSALAMPLRAYPGILLAQNRFHWVSISQALSSWIQFPVFWFLLHHGYGIRSYFFAFLICNLSSWALVVWKVHSGLNGPRLDFTGLQWHRFTELFKFSGSLAAGGLAEAILQSLPAVVLARFGGLHLIPVYNLTQRGPQILINLCNRMGHAFYPDLQRTFVAGETNRFLRKYQSVSTLGIWFSLAASGGIITFNRTLTCWLANEGFYAGHWTNFLFACSVVILPFVSSTLYLLQVSGDMGKMALISILEVPVTLLLCYAGYTITGTTGIAAACLLVPLLLRLPYCILRSCLNYKTSPYGIHRKPIGALIVGLLILSAASFCLSRIHAHAQPVMIFGRPTFAPHTMELCIGLTLVLVSVWKVRSHLQRLRRGTPGFQRTV